MRGELEKALTEEKQLRADEAQKHQEILDETEQRATSAQRESNILKAKPTQWLSTLTRINNEMASKFLLLFFFVLADITYIPACSLTRC